MRPPCELCGRGHPFAHCLRTDTLEYRRRDAEDFDAWLTALRASQHPEPRLRPGATLLLCLLLAVGFAVALHLAPGAGR